MKAEVKELNYLAAGIVFSVFPAAFIINWRFPRAELAESFMHALMLAGSGLVMHNAYFYASRRIRKGLVNFAKPAVMLVFGFLLCPSLVPLALFTDYMYPAYIILSLIASGVFVELTK